MGKAKIVIIVGPTATGKSSLAVRLAHDLNGAVINADSVQIYRHLNIGTAKPGADEMGSVPHHLINILDPDEPFSAADFRNAAGKTIKEITGQGSNVFVVGGTGLYVKILTSGIIDVPPVNPKLREELKREAEERGVKALYDELKEVDSVTAESLSGNDLFRIIRALEVYRTAGVPVSKIREEHAFKEREYETLTVGLKLDRDALYKSIEERVDRMLTAGLEDEVRGLLKMGYTDELKPLSSIGYKQMIKYLNGGISYDEAVRLIKRDTKRYAKRQLTWFNKDKDIIWYDAKEVLTGGGYKSLKQQVENFLE
jgi:tRNA dimethylallyltransferase